MSEKTGIFICDCGGTLFSKKDAANIASQILCNGKPCKDIFHLSTLCTEPELSSIAKPVRERGIDRIVFAGCSPVRNEELLERIAQKAGLSPGAVYGVNIRHEESVKQAVSAINRGIHAFSLIPSFEVKTIPLNRKVLIIGGGIAGIQTASEIKALGYDTTLVESSEKTGGRFFRGECISDIPGMLKGVKVYTGSCLKDLSGHIGSFKAKIHTPEGDKPLDFGAIVLAAGIADAEISNEAGNPLHNKNFMVPMHEIEGTVANLRRKNGARPIGLILDINIDETKASMETALNISSRLQRRGYRQVHLFCRDARVAAPGLEKLYDEARETGVNIVKYEGKPSLIEGEGGVSITYRDSILGEEISLHCDFVGISTRGIDSSADSALVSITGVSVDSLGQMQDNNIHLFPEQTNRPGIFVVGACRGQDYIPQIITEARAAALAVHSLLEKGSIEIELSNAVVDPDKCILCLTCVRSCPFKAMQVDKEKGAAMSIPEACRKCGICVGECPAKAIELPVFSNQVLLSQIGIG
jgi:heterodisulfide reductase subunit A-like polyferredoxin